jgi:hypothetical protein
VSLPESTEQKIAWDLRGAWIAGRRVSVALDTSVCLVPRVAGTVTYVAPTGAYAEIREERGEEPWRISCVDVLALRFPHFSEPADRPRAARREAPEIAPGQTSLLTLLGWDG